MSDPGQPGKERLVVDTEPVTSHSSKKVMLRAERDDTALVAGEEMDVRRRQHTYHGTVLYLEDSEETVYRLIAPGPQNELELWQAVTDDDGFREGWILLGEFTADIVGTSFYDLCPYCHEPLKTLQHEREAAVGACNRGESA